MSNISWIQAEFWLKILCVYASIVTLLLALDSGRLPLSISIGVFFIIGWLQYVLVQGMHEACHQCCTGWEKLTSGILLFYTIGLTPAYREIHLAHHRKFNSEFDPDFFAYKAFPSSRLKFSIEILKRILPLEAIKQFVKQVLGRSSEKNRQSKIKPLRSSYQELITLVLVQSLILSMFWFYEGLIDGSLAYLLFWVLPICSVVKVLSYLRILTEHGDPKLGPVLRSFEYSAFQGRILSPFGFQRHAEHHLHLDVRHKILKKFKVDWESKKVIRRLESMHTCHIEYPNSQFTLLYHWFRELPWHERGK